MRRAAAVGWTIWTVVAMAFLCLFEKTDDVRAQSLGRGPSMEIKETMRLTRVLD